MPGYRECGPAARSDLGRRSLTRIRVAGVERNRRAGLGERRGDGEPDTSAASGDQRDATIEGKPFCDAHGQLRLEVPA